MGRPKKQPKHLEKLTLELVLHDEVKKILIDYNVPRPGWTYMDVFLLIQWLLWPELFNTIQTEVQKPFEITYTVPLVSFKNNAELTPEHMKIARALHLAKLFAESPDGLIEALPKIRKTILKNFSNPQKKVVLDEAIRSGWMKHSPNFWTKSANELTGKDTTPRTIENAREKIRTILR